MSDEMWFKSPVSTGMEAGVTVSAHVGYLGVKYRKFRNLEASLSLVHDNSVSTAHRKIEAVFYTRFFGYPVSHARRDRLEWNVRVEDGRYIVAGDGLWRSDPNATSEPQYINLKKLEGTRDSGDPNLINIKIHVGSDIAVQTSVVENEAAWSVGGSGKIGEAGGVSVQRQEATTSLGSTRSVGGSDWFIPLRLRLVPPPKDVRFKMEYNNFSLTSGRMVLFKSDSAQVEKNPTTGKDYLQEIDEYLGGFDSEDDGGRGVEVTIHAHASRVNRSGNPNHNVNLSDERANAIRKVVKRRLPRADVAAISRSDFTAEKLLLPPVDDSQMHRVVFIVVKYPVRAPVVVQ